MEDLALYFAPMGFHIIMIFVMTEYYLATRIMTLNGYHDKLVDNCLRIAFYISWAVVAGVPMFYEVGGETLREAHLPLFVATMIVYGSILAIAWFLELKKKQI